MYLIKLLFIDIIRICLNLCLFRCCNAVIMLIPNLLILLLSINELNHTFMQSLVFIVFLSSIIFLCVLQYLLKFLVILTFIDIQHLIIRTLHFTLFSLQIINHIISYPHLDDFHEIFELLLIFNIFDVEFHQTL